jgi:hypothetical protein
VSVEVILLQVGGASVAYAVILLIIDYCSYFQSTLFTTLDGSGRGIDQNYRSPPYHPLCHWVLLLIAALGWIVIVLLFGIHVRFDFAPIVAVLVGGFLVARYVLMRRGIS